MILYLMSSLSVYDILIWYDEIRMLLALGDKRQESLLKKIEEDSNTFSEGREG